MRRQLVRSFAWILFVGLAVSLPSMAAGPTPPNSPQDRIDVLGHFRLTSGPVIRLIPTQHYSQYYLYAELKNGKTATVIDVTNATAPSRVADVSYPTNDQSDDLLAVTGTAALVAGPAPAEVPETPRSVRIMSFADPSHPTLVREFTGVTAIGRDAERGLVFLANPEGVWILRQDPAEDPAVVKAYQHDVLYDR